MKIRPLKDTSIYSSSKPENLEIHFFLNIFFLGGGDGETGGGSVGKVQKSVFFEWPLKRSGESEMKEREGKRKGMAKSNNLN